MVTLICFHFQVRLGSGEDQGQFEFASADLAKAKSNTNTDWIIVYFHRPLYSGSGSKNDGMRDMYHPLFQKYNVDLVLSGHAHNYQRTYPLNYHEDRPGKTSNIGPSNTTGDSINQEDKSLQLLAREECQFMALIKNLTLQVFTKVLDALMCK